MKNETNFNRLGLYRYNSRSFFDMEVLVSGLNSYLGRASISYLQGDGYNVHGLSRDIGLLSYKIKVPVTAHIATVDLIKRGQAYESFNLTGLDLSFYFTQIPDLEDKIAIQYELLSLRHFILLSQRNGCNRVIYVGRTYDKHCLQDIKALFKELDVVYTIVLKDVAVGQGTSFDHFVNTMMTNRYVFLFNPKKKIKFCPFVLEDIFRWIKKIPWNEAFRNEEIEFGGEQIIELEELLQACIEAQKNGNTYKDCRVVSVPSKTLAQILNKSMYGIPYDSYSEYILKAARGKLADNSKWQSLFPFDYTPVLSALKY